MSTKEKKSPAQAQKERTLPTVAEQYKKLQGIDKHLATALHEHATNFCYAESKQQLWEQFKSWLSNEDTEPEERSKAMFLHETTLMVLEALHIYFAYPGPDYELALFANKEVNHEN
jgi:hypothetical protein